MNINLYLCLYVSHQSIVILKLVCEKFVGDGARQVERIVVKFGAPVHAAFKAFFLDISHT